MATKEKSSGIISGPKHGPGGPSTKERIPFPTGPSSGSSGGAGGIPSGGTSGGTSTGPSSGAGPGSGPGGSPSGGSGSGSSGVPGGGPGGAPSGGPGTSGPPGSGASGAPGSGSSGLPGDGGGSTNGNGHSGDPNFNSSIANGFISLLQNATSPDAMNAQSIILRRIALEGDVVSSRVPPPKNITEIGGYLNYLTTTNQAEMRSQSLAGILGVAGPNPPLGWLSSGQPALAFVKFQNDRPTGVAQPTIPLTILIRSDFAEAFKAALSMLHNQGCMLPLQNGPTTVPLAAPGASHPTDMLPYLGRTLDIVSTTALLDPATDPIALVRSSGTSNPYEIAARVLSTGIVPVAAANYEAIKCTATGASTVALTSTRMVAIATAMQSVGFYAASPLPMPTSLSSTTWTRLTNITGLIKGVTKLGDELSLLYSWADIQNSVFANALSLVWNGSVFSTP